MIQIGIERLAASPPLWLEGKRLALLCNQASTTRGFEHSRAVIERLFPGRLVCLFSPQHGFFSEKQDNMIESGHLRDVAGLPIYSLYGDSRRPNPAVFTEFDVLLVDLIDVGTRVYTFVWTLIYCLEAAAEAGCKVVVLDRPNPIGGELIEGNVLRKEWKSFVGLHPIPMRHGLTLGELALLCNKEMGINADLEVVRMQGWKRRMYFSETGFPWVFPSPNMPSPLTALVYPGQVIWEGTNVSEGRGTTLPFEIFGAPYWDLGRLSRELGSKNLPGCVMRPLVFEPCFNKWTSLACNGYQIHVTDPEAFRPYRTSLTFLSLMLQHFKADFAYKQPPYEYEYERLPLDMIFGDDHIRTTLENGVEVFELEKQWAGGLAEYDERRRAVFLYD
ncbi:MAG: DUF1343 domain-containing protein [Desulfobulbaceae bacterium]|nr:DUF1343 domain-containing protein [Desulfobulbaceae bacterium]